MVYTLTFFELVQGSHLEP